MTDAPFDPADLLGDDELTFEEPAPEPKAKKRRAPRKTRAAGVDAAPEAAAETSAAPQAANDPFDFSMLDAAPEAPAASAPAPAGDPFDFDALEAAPAPAPAPSKPAAEPAPFDFAMFEAAAPAAPAPAEPAAPVAMPPVAAKPAAPATRRLSALLTDRIVAGAAALSCLASLASLGAVVSIGRSLSAVEHERDVARGEADALARIPATAAAIDAASARLAAATARAQAGQPLTADQLHEALDGLRVAMAARQPDGLTPLVGLTRDGFSEVATRLDRLEARGGGATPDRRGGRAPYPAPPS